MMPSASKIRARRNKLWRLRGGLCHWCGIKTVLPQFLPKGRGTQPGHMATLDHLDDRLSGRRGSFTGKGVERTVLSCLKCNSERGKESEAALSKAELQYRAKRQPTRHEAAYRQFRYTTASGVRA